jgi:hypothetical protein
MSVIPDLLAPPCCTYPGDTSATVGNVAGPNMFGEMLVVTAAVYDPATDRTRCTFRYLTQHDVDAFAEHEAHVRDFLVEFIAAPPETLAGTNVRSPHGPDCTS